MKKLFIFLLLVTAFTSNYKAQTSNNWLALNTGHVLNYGFSKLIVKHNCVYVFNSNFSTLLRSVNRGLSWDSLYIPSDSSHHEYIDLTFVNDSVGYLAGYDGSLFSGYPIESVVKKTIDRGQTWQAVKSGIINNSILTHITFLNENQGMAFGTAKMHTYMFATSDGGSNWFYLQNFSPAIEQVNSSSFSGANGAVTGIGHSMHIGLTQDGGSTWDIKHFHGSSSANGLKFFDNLHGVVIANDSIFITMDGLNSFSSKTKFPYANFIKSFDMLDMERGFFCTNTEIYYTGDAGNSWILSYSNPAIQLVDLKIEGNYVFATTCGSNTLLKLDISDLVLGVPETKYDGKALLLYPNPATDKVFIADAKGEKLLTATVTDQLGRIVKKQGLSEVKTIDLKELTPGIYIVEINSERKTYINKLIISQK